MPHEANIFIGILVLISIIFLLFDKKNKNGNDNVSTN